MGKAGNQAIKLAKDFKKNAERKFGLKKMILFGSFATGRQREGSDIDLLIVSNHSSNRARFMTELYREWHLLQKKKQPVDFICFTEKEFDSKSKQITIVKQAIEEGIEL